MEGDKRVADRMVCAYRKGISANAKPRMQKRMITMKFDTPSCMWCGLFIKEIYATADISKCKRLLAPNMPCKNFLRNHAG